MYLAVIIFLFAAASFTAATFAYFTGIDQAPAQLVTLSIPTAFLLVIVLSFRRHHIALLLAGKVTSALMGFLNFAFLAALACWPVLLLAHAANIAISRTDIAVTLFAAAGLVSLYGLLHAKKLHVTRYTIQLPHLPKEWQGCDVALVSDIHVGVIWGEGLVREIISRLNELKPKAVFISGDMFDGARLDVSRAVEPWSTFRVDAGVFFVTGNHDEFSDPTPYINALTHAGVRVLHNERVTVAGLQIVGINDSTTHSPSRYKQVLEALRIDPNQPSVLLAHRPAHLKIAAAAGISLQLSGHTHAGQFPLWTVLVRQVYGRFAYGHNHLGPLQVVTSSGAGSGGPPLRVGTRSEIVLLRLEAVNPNQV